MLNSWFGKSTKPTHRSQSPSDPLSFTSNSQSTLEPPPSGLAPHASSSHLDSSPLSSTDKILAHREDAHAQINDPNIYTGPLIVPLVDVPLEDMTSKSPPGPEEEILEPLFTPHDAILSDLHGHNPIPNQAPQPIIPNQNTSTTGTFSTVTSAHTHGPAADVIYDPFSGHKLAECAANLKQPGGGRDEELWTHLSRILELQSEVAAMHGDMENVRTRTRSGSVPHARNTDPPHRQKKPVRRTAPADDSDTDEEGEGKRKRDEEFAKLSERFEERKAAVNSIMGKLDELSTALKTFHALRTPPVDIPSSRSPTSEPDTSSLPALPKLSHHNEPPPPLVASPASTFSVPAPLTRSGIRTTILEEAPQVDSPLESQQSLTTGILKG